VRDEVQLSMKYMYIVSLKFPGLPRDHFLADYEEGSTVQISLKCDAQNL
jgi:hypothetical protein